MKVLSILLISAALVSCGVAVTLDYDKKIDFSQYTVYNFYPEIDSGLNELDNKRIIKAIDSVFQRQGYKKSNANQFHINFYAKESLSNSRNTIGIGVGGGGRNVGVGVSGGIPIGGKVINQTLTIDFIDTTRDMLIWQVIAEGKLKEKATPGEKEAYYIKVVEKALKNYPPK